MNETDRASFYYACFYGAGLLLFAFYLSCKKE